MIFKNRLALITLLVIFIYNSACATNSLTVVPVEIGVFRGHKIFAMDEMGKYQLGWPGEKWSRVYDIQDKGLSLLDLVVSTDAGLYLIGAERDSASDNNAPYTGLIVLVSEDNKTIKEWRTENNFIKVDTFKNKLILTAFNGVYTLDAHNGMQKIRENNKREKWIPLHDVQGELILCQAISSNKNASIPTETTGCVKEGEWSTEGMWYASNTKYKTEPLTCGKWLVEPVQLQYNTPVVGLNISSLSSGVIIKKYKVHNVQRFFCINNSEVILDNNQNSLLLPEMKSENKYSCRKNERVVSIKSTNDKNICLTESGYVGFLKKIN